MRRKRIAFYYVAMTCAEKSPDSVLCGKEEHELGEAGERGDRPASTGDQVIDPVNTRLATWRSSGCRMCCSILPTHVTSAAMDRLRSRRSRCFTRVLESISSRRS